jgi:hypothetical protein
MFAKRSLLLILLVAAAAPGCKSDDMPDARQLPAPSTDARLSDAAPGSSDARPGDAGASADARADAGGTPDGSVSDAAVADAPMAMPDAMATGPDAPIPTGGATLIINEVSPSGETNNKVELLAIAGGNVEDIVLRQDITADVEILAVLPDTIVATGDIIVVHLRPEDGIVEEVGTDEDCTDPACYDSAWDVRGETSADDQEVGYSHRVLYLLGPDDAFMDAVPFMRHPADRPGFLNDLLYITGESTPGIAFWQSKCAMPCDFENVQNMYDATVNWTAAGPAPSGDTVQRKTGAPNTRTVEDWQATVQPQTLGLPN